jgi:hypothetical protein
VPRHVARLIVDYFAHAMRPGASARRRLLCPRRASGCLGPSRGSSSTTSPMLCDRVPRLVTHLVVDYFAYVARHVSPHVARLVVDYFAYVVRPGATACPTARRAAQHRLLQLCRASGCSARRTARRRLLRPHRASGCLGTSRGSSSTTSPTPLI